MTGHPGRLEHRSPSISETEEGPVGHHEVHLHRLHLAPGPARQEPQRGVGRNRTRPATLWCLVRAQPRHHSPGPALQRRVRAHDVLERAQHRQVGHPVRCGAHGHPAGPHRRLHPRHDRRRVQLRRDPARRPPHTRTPNRPSSGASRRSSSPRSATVNRRGLLHHLDGVALPDHPRRQRGHRARQLRDQRLRQPHEPVPETRGLPPRQRDLRPDRPHRVARRPRAAPPRRRAPDRRRLPRLPQRVRSPAPAPPTPPPSPAPARQRAPPARHPTTPQRPPERGPPGTRTPRPRPTARPGRRRCPPTPCPHSRPLFPPAYDDAMTLPPTLLLTCGETRPRRGRRPGTFRSLPSVDTRVSARIGTYDGGRCTGGTPVDSTQRSPSTPRVNSEQQDRPHARPRGDPFRR